MKRVIELTVWLAVLAAVPALAQSRPQTPPPPPPGVTPQPADRGAAATGGSATGQAPRTQPQPQAPPAENPGRRAPAAPATTTPAPASVPVVPTEPAPTEGQLGVPIYPGATFLQSFDAGQGQRYYLFGSTASFTDVVAYYRKQLKNNGDLVYDVPPVHMFEVGRFREEAMAFPPGVTVKDYTSGGAKGYLVPTPGASPSRFPSVIQIVPVTAANR